jgi:hypothetical protein
MLKSPMVILLFAVVAALASCKSKPDVAAPVSQPGSGSALTAPLEVTAPKKSDPAPPATVGSGSGTAVSDQDLFGQLQGTEFGDSQGTGWGTIGVAKDPPAPPGLISPALVAVGELDRAIVRRYLKRNVNRFTFCYENRGSANVTTVVLSFVINSQGAVSSASATGDKTFAESITQVVKAIEFPRPKKGEVKVTVTLDFSLLVLKPSAK